MKLDKDTFRGRLMMALVGPLARLFVTLLSLTWRVKIHGQERLDALRHEAQPVIVTFWHDRVILAIRFLLRHLHRRGIPLTLMASQSRDGEIVAQLAEGWKVNVVRGSASRGGLRALRGAHRAISKAKSSPIIAPDGPRGPQYHFKIGVQVLAQISGAPILPLGFAAERCWHLKSWDRLIVPKPFSRVAVVIGQPEPVATGLVGEAKEAERQRLQTVLDDLTAEAEDKVRTRD